jgi:hypothetical protein
MKYLLVSRIRLPRLYSFGDGNFHPSKNFFTITPDDEAALKNILKDKNFIDRFIGFYIDDDIHAQVTQNEKGTCDGGNLGIVLEYPTDKKGLRYVLRGYSVPPAMLMELSDWHSEGVDKVPDYNRTALLNIASFLAIDNVIKMRQVALVSELNHRLEIHVGEHDKYKSKQSFLVAEETSVEEVIKPDLSPEKRAVMDVRFKPIPQPYSVGDNIPGIKKCVVRIFRSPPPKVEEPKQAIEAEPAQQPRI